MFVVGYGAACQLLFAVQTRRLEGARDLKTLDMRRTGAKAKTVCPSNPVIIPSKILDDLLQVLAATGLKKAEV